MHWEDRGIHVDAIAESYEGFTSDTSPCSGFVTVDDEGVPCAGFRQCGSKTGLTGLNHGGWTNCTRKGSAPAHAMRRVGGAVSRSRSVMHSSTPHTPNRSQPRTRGTPPSSYAVPRTTTSPSGGPRSTSSRCTTSAASRTTRYAHSTVIHAYSMQRSAAVSAAE